jgi:late competence protein required for DNA uptake (superfamily II DNA/RNA helicase)
MKPIFKFNGSNGAILCHNCRIIICEGITEEKAMKSGILYCKKCRISIKKRRDEKISSFIRIAIHNNPDK